MMGASANRVSESQTAPECGNPGNQSRGSLRTRRSCRSCRHGVETNRVAPSGKTHHRGSSYPRVLFRDEFRQLFEQLGAGDFIAVEQEQPVTRCVFPKPRSEAVPARELEADQDVADTFERPDVLRSGA